MKLIDLIVELMKARGTSLKALSKSLDFHQLESLQNIQPPVAITLPTSEDLQPSNVEVSIYFSLDEVIASLQIPSQLEDLCWTFPIYRLFAESDLDLNANVINPEWLKTFAKEALLYAEQETQQLLASFPDTAQKTLYKDVKNCWIQFQRKLLMRSV